MSIPKPGEGNEHELIVISGGHRSLAPIIPIVARANIPKVTQMQIAEALTSGRHIKFQKHLYDVQTGQIKSALENGAEIEEGPHHAWLETIQVSGGKSKTRLILA